MALRAEVVDLVRLDIAQHLLSEEESFRSP